jgi:peptidoglycan hydrolase CwlO-like protein
MSNRTAITFLAAAMIVGIAVFVAAFWPTTRPRFLQPPEMRLVQAEKDYWDTRFDRIEDTIQKAHQELWSAVNTVRGQAILLDKQVSEMQSIIDEVQANVDEVQANVDEVQEQETQHRVEDAE